MCLVVLLGFGAGYLLKGWADKKEDNRTAALGIPRSNNTSSLLTANELVAPDLYHIAFDPAFIPVVAPIPPEAVKALAVLPAIAPKVKTTIRDKDVQVAVALPGLKQQDVDLEVGKDALSIKARLADESRMKDKEVAAVKEAFQEVIPLPCPVDAENAKAVFKDGQLIVEIPKASNIAQGQYKNYQ